MCCSPQSLLLQLMYFAPPQYIDCNSSTTHWCSSSTYVHTYIQSYIKCMIQFLSIWSRNTRHIICITAAQTWCIIHRQQLPSVYSCWKIVISNWYLLVVMSKSSSCYRTFEEINILSIYSEQYAIRVCDVISSTVVAGGAAQRARVIIAFVVSEVLDFYDWEIVLTLVFDSFPVDMNSHQGFK